MWANALLLHHGQPKWCYASHPKQSFLYQGRLHIPKIILLRKIYFTLTLWYPLTFGCSYSENKIFLLSTFESREWDQTPLIQIWSFLYSNHNRSLSTIMENVYCENCEVSKLLRSKMNLPFSMNCMEYPGIVLGKFLNFFVSDLAHRCQSQQHLASGQH